LKPWGWSLSVDLKSCNSDLIRDAEAIKNFVVELCNLIEMKRYGECHVINFGEDPDVAGFSMFQLIETSNISAHFVNKTNAIYLDVFSCKEYDPQMVAQFAEIYFEAQSYQTNFIERLA